MQNIKTILVTGGCGFIGSHVVDMLVENNYKVIVIDKYLQYENVNAIYYKANICSTDIEHIFQQHNVDVVIHLAAQVSVSLSNKNPIEDANCNIIGSINLIEIAKKYNIAKIIVASTAALYGKPTNFPVKENDENKYLSPYAISKHALEQYVKISGINYLIYRFSNVYGPRQSNSGEAGVVSIFINKILQGMPVEIYGSGEQTRDFIYVKDIARAILLGIKLNINNETINISTNSECTINQLFNEIKRHSDYTLQPIYTKERRGDIYRSVLDNQKAKILLNWQPSTELSEGLTYTVDFFKGRI